MDKQLTRTTTIGQYLHRISKASREEKEVLMETIYSMIENHPEEQLLLVLVEHAKSGYSRANLGRNAPPDLSEDDITIKIEDNCAYAQW